MSFYQLDYSGSQVNEAIGRVLEQPEVGSVSHITDLDSTATVPYNLNTLVEAGIFRCMYLDPDTVPEEVAKTHPVFIFTATVEGSSPEATGPHFTQTITCGLRNYSRFTTDNGASWSEWDYPKEITAEEVLAMFSEEGASLDLISRVMARVVNKSTSPNLNAPTKSSLKKGVAS